MPRNPDAFRKLFRRYEREYGLPEGLLEEVARVESGFNPRAIGPRTRFGTAKGLMQIMVEPNEFEGDPFNPEEAIPFAASLLRRDIDRFGSVDLALAAYNAGPGRVGRILEEVGYEGPDDFPKVFGRLPEETRNYIPNVTRYRDFEAGGQERLPTVAEPFSNPAAHLRQLEQSHGLLHNRPDPPNLNARARIRELEVEHGLREPDSGTFFSGLDPYDITDEARAHLQTDLTFLEEETGDRYIEEKGYQRLQRAVAQGGGQGMALGGVMAEVDQAERLGPGPGLEGPDQEESKGFFRQLGRDILDSYQPWQADITPRERIFRTANLASLAIPWGAAARLPGLMRAFPALKAATTTRKGQVAVGAVTEGAIAGGLEAIRGPDPDTGDSHIVGSTVFGATLGGVIGRFGGAAGRAARQAKSKEVAARFADPATIGTNQSALFNESYAILSPGHPQMNAKTRAFFLQRMEKQMARLGHDPMQVKMNGRDALLIPGVDQRTAVDLAQSSQAASVLTSDGLVDFQRGLLYPMDSSRTVFGRAVKPDEGDFYVALRTNSGDLLAGPRFDLENPVRLGYEEAASSATSRLNRLFARSDDAAEGWGRGMWEKFRSMDSVSAINSWYRKTVRNLHGVEQVQRFLGQGKTRGAGDVASKLELFQNRYGTMVEQALNRGIPKSLGMDASGKPTMEFSSRGLLQIWGDNISPAEMPSFEHYGAARAILQRAREHGEKVIPRVDGKPVISTKEAHEIVSTAPEHFRKAFDETLTWQNEFLRATLVDSGMLTPKQFTSITRLPDGSLRDFVPFSRLRDTTRAVDETSSDIFALFNPIKRVGGSQGEETFEAWTTEVVRRSALFARMADQQRGINEVYRMMQGAVDTGTFGWQDSMARLGLRVVDSPPSEATPMNRSFKAALGDMLPGGEGGVRAAQQAREEGGEALMDALTPPVVSWNDAGYVRFQGPEGKPIWAQITDEALWDGVKSLGPTDLGAWHDLAQFASVPASALRAGITLGFGFMAKNPIRDVLFGFVNMGMNPVAPIRGLASMLRKDDYFQAWFHGGGPRSALVSMDRPAVQNMIQDIQNLEGGQLRNVVKSPRQWFDALRAVSEGLENTSRLGMFRQTWGRAIKEGLSPEEALREASLASKRVSVNFSMSGSSQIAQTARATTTFWNAIVQGVDQITRSALDNPQAFMARGGLLTAASVGLYMVNRKDEEYRHGIPQWEKNLFWHMKAPNGDWIRFPKPFEPGILFGSLPERFLEAMDDSDSRSLDEYSKQLVRITSGSLAPVPTVFVPWMESLANENFFTGAPLVSPGLEDVDPDFHGRPNTSRLAVGMARMLNQGEDNPRDKISPLVLDNLFQGYTGELGKFAYQDLSEALTDAFRVRVMGKDVDPAQDMRTGFRRITGAQTFFSSYPYSSQALDDLYTQAERARSAAGTAAYLERNLMVDDWVRHMEENIVELNLAPVVQDVMEQVAELRETRDQIMASNMNSESKRQEIRRLSEMMSQLAIPYVRILDAEGLRRW